LTIRKGHGDGAGVPRVEVLPASEVPAGVPEDARTESPTDRGEAGRFAPGNSLARLGGHARRGKTRLADRLGLRAVGESSEFRSYKAAAVSFRRAQCSELARTVGGGVCGPAPSSLVASAALQLAWSRFLSDTAAIDGNADLALKASRLAEASRQSLLAAHELCAREAMSRTKGTRRGWQALAPAREPEGGSR
jgi:hypothetical protein